MVGFSAYNGTGKGKWLFLFPENPRLRNQWVTNMKRANFRPRAASRLRQDHFKTIYFEGNPSKAIEISASHIVKQAGGLTRDAVKETIGNTRLLPWPPTVES